MRKLTIVVLLLAASLAMANVNLSVQSVGFNGYYRQNTLVPVAVLLENDGEEVSGELHIALPSADYRAGQPLSHYHLPLTLPAGARQLRMLYVVPSIMLSSVTVEFLAKGQQPVSVKTDQLHMLNDNDRLIAVIGGNASSLAYLNGQPFSPEFEVPTPRSWDIGAYQHFLEAKQSAENRKHALSSGATMYSPRPGMSSTTTSSAPTGTMRVTYLAPELLPENPEAYGSITEIALMADVTENTLGAAGPAIKEWVGKGGHLLCASGGVPSRLLSPFFADMLPESNGQRRAGARELTGSGGLSAVTAAYCNGQVSLLHVDPDITPLGDWRAVAGFYGNLLARDTPEAMSFRMYNVNYNAVMVRNLKPINMHYIMLFLLGYVIILVPVNFFLLKKLNKREWIWATSLATMLLFTVGAYGIGLLSKGHQLLVNNVTLLETSLGQRSALADSQTLLFSPATRTYTIDTGETGLFIHEATRGYDGEYGGEEYSNQSNTTPLNFTLNGNAVSVKDVPLDMWSIRQFITIHRVDLGSGFSARLSETVGSPLPEGTITNNTPCYFNSCSLMRAGQQLASFAMRPGQTINLRSIPPLTDAELGLTPDEKTIMTNIDGQGFYGGNAPGGQGLQLVCYSDDPLARVPVKVNGAPPTSSLTVVVVHL